MKIQAIMYVLNFILCANYTYNLYIDSLLVMVNSAHSSILSLEYSYDVYIMWCICNICSYGYSFLQLPIFRR